MLGNHNGNIGSSELTPFKLVYVTSLYGMNLPQCSHLGFWDCHTQEGRVYGDTLGTVVSFEDANKPVGQLKHVVAKTYNDELSVLCSFLYCIVMFVCVREIG